MRRVGFYVHPSFLMHDTGPGHPERPARVQAICDRLQAYGVWEALIHRLPEPASLETVGLVHPVSYIQQVERRCHEGPVAFDPDTVAGPASWEATLRAVGAVAQAVAGVCHGELEAAFCAVRPPGHHALPERAMGFCLFNNIAIAARDAQRCYGCPRVLIVDWDVHHGNGTQAIFYDDPTVFYFSLHQFPFYPGSGSAAETGAGAGRGTTLNIPLPAGSGDAAVLEAVREQLVPQARAFRPDLVLVSAGFDAHRDDPLAGLAVTEAGYAEMTRLVRGIAEEHCRGRLVAALEGGYDLGALGRSVEAHLRVLLADRP